MENVSVTLVAVLALGSLIMVAAIITVADAVRVERRHHALRGIDPEAPRLRAGSQSSDIHLIVRFDAPRAPEALVHAIGGMMDVDGLRGASRDLALALPDASHAHVSCAHFHDIRPRKLPGEGVHVYLRVRTRKPVALPEGDLDRALVGLLLERLGAIDTDALVEAKAVVAKPSTDPAAARLVLLP